MKDKTSILREHYLKEKRISLYMLLGLSGIFLFGIILFYFTPKPIWSGFAMASFIFAIAVLLSEGKRFWFYTSKEEEYFFGENGMPTVEDLMLKTKHNINLDSIVFFLGLILVFLGAFTFQNKMWIGSGIALCIWAGIKLSMDLFSDWRRSETLRHLKK